MKTIRVAMDVDLVRAADRAARRARVNRSVLVCEALREHLRRLELRELETRDRAGYEKHPEDSAEGANWERVAAWPER